MKTALLGIAALTTVLLTFAACNGFVIPTGRVTGSGKLETRDFPLADFSRVEASSAVRIEIARSDSFQVSVEADDNLREYVEVTKSGGTLRVSLKSGYGYYRTTVRAIVGMPKLEGLALSGAVNGTIAGFATATNLDTEVSGASSLKGDFVAADLSLEISGASSATLTGSARDLTIRASGASRANMVDLLAVDADVEVSGASNATVNVTGNLDASASGASSVRYTGKPTVGRQNASGASTIRPQ